MRGALLPGALGYAQRRIIPAYAGSTKYEFHRRVRRKGSSPRMRGALHVGLAPGGAHGIIPAYAGSTLAAGSSAIASRDHPRVCGEHYATAQEGISNGGSSPRMRGARDGIQALSALGRIIPAYAGSTWVLLCTVMICPDHPRVCGEHATTDVVATFCLGSSPRMRGALENIVISLQSRGIIPAYAGSTKT